MKNAEFKTIKDIKTESNLSTKIKLKKYWSKDLLDKYGNGEPKSLEIEEYLNEDSSDEYLTDEYAPQRINPYYEYQNRRNNLLFGDYEDSTLSTTFKSFIIKENFFNKNLFIDSQKIFIIPTTINNNKEHDIIEFYTINFFLFFLAVLCFSLHIQFFISCHKHLKHNKKKLTKNKDIKDIRKIYKYKYKSKAKYNTFKFILKKLNKKKKNVKKININLTDEFIEILPDLMQEYKTILFNIKNIICFISFTKNYKNNPNVLRFFLNGQAKIYSQFRTEFDTLLYNKISNSIKKFKNLKILPIIDNIINEEDEDIIIDNDKNKFKIKKIEDLEDLEDF